MTEVDAETTTLPTVSVIIPAYNDHERLKICLYALAVQTYPSELIEVVVVDNGSEVLPDFVVDICASAKLFTESKKGSYAARNKGINNSRGKVLIFTDSDCTPSHEWIEHGVNALLQADEDVVVGGPIEFTFQDAANPTACELLETVFGFRQEINITKSHYTVTANLFSWRRMFDDVGLFNDELSSGGDQEWGKRAFAAGNKIIYKSNVVIQHPARHSLKDTLKKRKRVTLGLCDLAKGNNSYKIRLLIKLIKIFPSVRYRILPILRTNNLSTRDKLRLCRLTSGLHFYEYWHCLMHAHYLFYFSLKAGVDE